MPCRWQVVADVVKWGVKRLSAWVHPPCRFGVSLFSQRRARHADSHASWAKFIWPRFRFCSWRTSSDKTRRHGPSHRRFQRVCRHFSLQWLLSSSWPRAQNCVLVASRRPGPGPLAVVRADNCISIDFPSFTGIMLA